jgi:hypothetical protein
MRTVKSKIVKIREYIAKENILVKMPGRGETKIMVTIIDKIFISLDA